MKKLLLLSFVLLAFTACNLEDIVDEIEDSLSSFDATVSGDVTSSFSGNATFINSSVESQSPNSSTLFVYLTNGNDPDEEVQLSITLANVTGGVQAGTYQFDVNSTDAVVYTFYYNANSAFIYPDPTATNQIVLSKVENSRIEGTYNFTLTNNVTGGDKVTVTGSFKAIGTFETI